MHVGYSTVRGEGGHNSPFLSKSHRSFDFSPFPSLLLLGCGRAGLRGALYSPFLNIRLYIMSDFLLRFFLPFSRS